MANLIIYSIWALFLAQLGGQLIFCSTFYLQQGSVANNFQIIETAYAQNDEYEEYEDYDDESGWAGTRGTGLNFGIFNIVLFLGLMWWFSRGL